MGLCQSSPNTVRPSKDTAPQRPDHIPLTLRKGQRKAIPPLRLVMWDLDDTLILWDSLRRTNPRLFERMFKLNRIIQHAHLYRHELHDVQLMFPMTTHSLRFFTSPNSGASDDEYDSGEESPGSVASDVGATSPTHGMGDGPDEASFKSPVDRTRKARTRPGKTETATAADAFGGEVTILSPKASSAPVTQKKEAQFDAYADGTPASPLARAAMGQSPGAGIRRNPAGGKPHSARSGQRATPKAYRVKGGAGGVAEEPEPVRRVRSNSFHGATRQMSSRTEPVLSPTGNASGKRAKRVESKDDFNVITSPRNEIMVEDHVRRRERRPKPLLAGTAKARKAAGAAEFLAARYEELGMAFTQPLDLLLDRDSLDELASCRLILDAMEVPARVPTSIGVIKRLSNPQRGSQLKLRSGERIVHVVVTASLLLPALAKMMIMGLADYFHPEDVYSVWMQPKSTAFMQLIEAYGIPKEHAIAVGDGRNERESAAALGIPYFYTGHSTDVLDVEQAIIAGILDERAREEAHTRERGP